MKILDRYILFKFLSAFFFIVVLLVIVICVIDFTEKSEDFIRNKPSTHAIFLDYYGNYFFYMANMLSPITVFIASVFITARLTAHTEIVAMQSAGISFMRILLPYFIGSLFLGLSTFGLIGWIIPNANKTRIAFEVKYLKAPFFYQGRNFHLKIGPETYIYMESYNNPLNEGYQFTIETIKGTQLTSKLKGQKVKWNKENQKWRIENYSLHTFDGLKENISYGGAIDTALNLYPKDFESNHMLHETFTMNELDAYIAELKSRGGENIQPYLVDKYERYAYPFAIILLSLMGAIVSSRKSREGTGLQIAIGFALAFVYIIAVIMSRSIAKAGDVPPMLGAWIPNIFFTVVAIVLFRVARRQ